MMNVEIISKETIKPTSLTPPHLKKMMISLLGQLAPMMYIPVVLFFRPPPALTEDNHVKTFIEMSQCLRKSLSETLALFFYVAGRFEDDVSIDCNDKGVEYFEARVDCLLDVVLENSENDVLNSLVAVVDNNNTCAAVERCQLFVQINLFNCGEIAISVSFWHKLFDTSALTTFLKAWSAVALKTQGKEKAIIVVPPDFTTPALVFPPVKEIPTSSDIWGKSLDKNIIKKIVFDASKIAELRSKAASTCSVPINPTRVEAVSALIWKCTMKAGGKMMSGDTGKPYVIGSAMNFRKRLVPPLPENSMGNITGIYTAQSDGSDDQTDLGTLVNLLRKELMEACDFTKTLGAKNGNAGIFELFVKVANKMKTCRYLTCTSWCKFPFYEVDFGWGKPTWVGVPNMPCGDIVVLIDSKDGVGVEAYVSLSPEEMAVFERDPELLAFGSLKSNV